MNTSERERLDAGIQGVNKLFVLAYAHGDNATNENSYDKYFLPRLSNMMKSEKYQQDTVMITQLVVCWILLILIKITD